MKKIVFVLLIIGIFQLSNTPGLYVSQPSTWFNSPNYEKNLPIKQFFSIDGMFFTPYQNIDNKEFILHKLSHIVFFGLLTIAAYVNFKRKLFLSWLFVTFYALIDEIHQAFIVGRSGRAADVLLDSAASLFVVIIIYICIKQTRKKLKIGAE